MKLLEDKGFVLLISMVIVASYIVQMWAHYEEARLANAQLKQLQQ